MKILRVVGFALAIITFRYLVPDVYQALIKTLLMFFNIMQTGLSIGSSAMSAGALLPELPQLPIR